MKRPTLRDVARAANVSPGTASEALRGIGRISHSTRSRVQSIANSLNYRPNPILAALAARHFKPKGSAGIPVAIIVPEPEIFPDIIHRQSLIIGRATILGYQPHLIRVSPSTNPRVLNRTLYARGIEGIILDLGRFQHLCPPLDWSRYALVSVGPPPAGIDCHCTLGDHICGVFTALANVAACGYKRIGIAPVHHSPPHPDDLQRHAATLLAVRMHPSICTDPLLEADLNDTELLLRWITTNTPDAVIAFHAGVWWILHDHFNQRYDYACAVLVRPNRTSLTGDISGLLDSSPDMALAAMDLLAQAIRHQEHGIQTRPRKQLVPLHWHQGSTLRHK